MPKLSGQRRPGLGMHDHMDDLGFRSGVPMRQVFYDRLRTFHQDKKQPHRRTLNTVVDVNLVNREFINFMHEFGDYFFGLTHRGHLNDTAKMYIVGSSDDCISADFPAVRSALLLLSRNYERRRRRRGSSDSIQSDLEPYRNPDSVYSPTQSTFCETIPATGSLHSRKSTDSEQSSSPTPAESPEPRLKQSQTFTRDTHRTVAARVTDQSLTAEPWDVWDCAVDWGNVQTETQIPTNKHSNIRYSTRLSGRSNSTTMSDQRTRKRKFQDHDAKQISTKSRVCIQPRSTGADTPINKPRESLIQKPILEVHFCVPNARKAFEKWPHGGFRGHTIETFFRKVHERCGSKGRLTSIKFTLSDADPPHTWKVEEGDAIMFEFVKDKTRRILAEGIYVGIFEILMEPTVEIDQDDGGVAIVVDV